MQTRKACQLIALPWYLASFYNTVREKIPTILLESVWEEVIDRSHTTWTLAGSRSCVQEQGKDCRSKKQELYTEARTDAIDKSCLQELGHKQATRAVHTLYSSRNRSIRQELYTGAVYRSCIHELYIIQELYTGAGTRAGDRSWGSSRPRHEQETWNEFGSWGSLGNRN